MDGATLQAKIYAGYAKAALRIGLSFDQYRTTTATNPTATGNKLRTMYASFNAEDMGFSKPNKYGKPTWYGLFDGSLTRVGDYLKSASATYFIGAQQQALPILCVECNRMVTISRAAAQVAVGALGYGGRTQASDTALMSGWPASVLLAGRGDKAAVKLPGDSRDASWLVLLPAFAGVTLLAGDLITDDLGQRYVINSPELTDLGWRLSASQVQT